MSTLVKTLRKLQADAFEEMRKIDKPITLKLPKGAPRSPAVLEWIAKCEHVINAQAKDPNSEMNRKLFPLLRRKK